MLSYWKLLICAPGFIVSSRVLREVATSQDKTINNARPIAILSKVSLRVTRAVFRLP
jgi:hypothetical protein